MKKSIPCLSLLFLLITTFSFGQKEQTPLKAETGTLTFLGISQPINSLEEFPFPERHDFERNEEMKDRFYPNAENALPKGPDPVIQKFMGENYDSKGLTVNYDGISGTSYPPDPNGDVGPNHYFQTTNINYQIFDKAGNSLYGPADIRNFWGITEGVSDPVVLYDDNADRWFVEIFTTTPNPGGPFNIKFAISQTGNPLGSYYLYTLAGLPNLPDFTKFGVWRDGYYMSANSGSYDVYAFDRSSMIAGAPTGFVRFDNAWRPLSGFHCIMPLENDGAFAPSGTPGQFITINDDAWGGNDELWIYELDVDWNNTGAATFTRTQQITVASFDSNFGPSMDNIYQQGTAQRLDAVPQVLNYHAQYRNFGTHQTIVCNHSVDIDNTDHAGVRWYELRDTGGSWWLYQQSTYAPDAHSRWMGAIAMNAYGDIGLAYSVSSSSLYPGLRYTGRHASDPLGTMTFAEQSIWDGTNSQTYGNRWGDYYSMSVDPLDNRTFWFTGEYHGTNRRTRIAAIDFGVYCAASGGCDEYISDVFFGSINNSSGCTYYGDYTAMSTDLPLNGSEFLTIHNGNPIYTVDECGVWVDWNNDGDFYDANESIPVSNSPSEGPYYADITPPAGTTTGLKTMRIRIDYDTPPLPCGTATWGEVEDYNINVTPKVPAVWTGAFDENWHNADNWSTAYIPDATTDVIIPATTTKCWVWAGPAQCNNITIEFGSGNDLRIWDQDLEVYGDMDFWGQLLMDHTDGIITVQGNVTWRPGSSASIQANAIINVHGDWNFQSGANVEMNDGIVNFTGAGTSMIRSYEENCYFNNLVIYKTSPDWAGISNFSTENLHINGDLIIQAGSEMYLSSPESVILQGNLVNFGSLYGNAGTVVFNGSDQSIIGTVSYPTTLYFNNLLISSAISTSILNKDITINGNLTIEEGQFNTNDHTISIQGNWNNQIGTDAFVEGNGRVIFKGGYSIINGDEEFNILELNKVNDDVSFLDIDGCTVTCQQYDWTSGVGVNVKEGGVFTAFDLMDNGIFGGWRIYNNGTINISNYGSGQWVDMNGIIRLIGGTMNVYGGDGISYWPYAANAEIHMTEGSVLDFHDQGIRIYDSPTYTLTENITGGTIRTAGGFWGEFADFRPDYGTMEFYGSEDATVYTMNACKLNDVIINKGSKDETSTKTTGTSVHTLLIDERSGKTISDGTKSNMITLGGFLKIGGDLTINNGVLNSADNHINISGDWINNVGDSGFDETTGEVIFEGNVIEHILANEVFADISVETRLEISDNIEVDVTGRLHIYAGFLQLGTYSDIRIDGNLFISSGACFRANSGGSEIEIGGNWVNNNPVNNYTQGYYAGGEVVTFNGSSDQGLSTYAPEEYFSNLHINKTGGSVKPADNIRVGAFFVIFNGDWLDLGYGLNHKFEGDILIEAGGGYYPLGITTITGTGDQYYTNNGGTAMFGDLVIEKTGILHLNSDMVVFNNHTTTIEEGTLNLNGNQFKSIGNININDGGELLVDAGAWLSIVAGLYVNNGGEFTASGVNGNNAHIWKDVVGYYEFEVNSGGSISAKYTDFKDMDEDGILVKDGANVDPANCFNNCNFYDQYISPPNSRLFINTDQVLSINNINFYNNPNIQYCFNIGKSNNLGEIVITTTGGDFTGPLFEWDPDNRIHWADYVHGLWTGAVSSDWIDNNNWSDFQTPSVTTDVVIPAGTPHNPKLQYSPASCNNLVIESGASMEIVDDALAVVNNCEIYGQLIMNHPLAYLECISGIYWKPGSTADVTDGYIRANSWFWEEGTNAQLGTGNTAGVRSTIGNYDQDASFGNLDLYPLTPKDLGKVKTNYPLKVTGDCVAMYGSNWQTSIDWFIDGNWEIMDGASFTVWNDAQINCNSQFILDGELILQDPSSVVVHGLFTFGSTGILNIDNSSFLCDFNVPTGWIDLLGDIQMTSGSMEFPDASIRFAGTSTISGGTVSTGLSAAANVAGAFQPSGGILELVGGDAGHYLQITNGNYVNELHVNRSSPIGIHPGSPLTTQGYVVLNSEFMVQGNTLTANGDLHVNAGSVLNIDDLAILKMADNKWLAVNAGGTLEVIGLAGNQATITHSTGHYNFWVGDGATISAEHAIFEYMETDGVHLNFGSIVDPVHSFNNCIFQNGATGGNIMTIDNTQDFTVNNAEFPTNTWGGVYNVFKTSASGNTTFIDASGGFAGEAFEYDPNNLVHWGAPELRLDLTVFLEGPFNGTSMNTDINSILPLNSPFDPTLPYFGNPLPDWYYAAGGSVGSIPVSTIVDWILVQLRDAGSPATALPATEIGTSSAFVLNNGKVVSLDGSSPVSFSVTPANNLYAIIWHRNHLGVISANPLIESGGIYSYDFSS